MMEDFVEVKKGLQVETEVPVFKIEKGHCRTAAARTADGRLVFLLCVTDQYGTPGQVVENGGELMPLVGLELWGTEQLRILGKCCEMAADQLDERMAADNAGDT